MVSLAALKPCNSTAASTIISTHSSDCTISEHRTCILQIQKLNLRLFSFAVNRCPRKTPSSQPRGLLKGTKPPLKGFVAVFRAAASPSSASGRELLPAYWPEPPPAGWSCSGSVDEAAVLPQAVGHDRPSPPHRLATALWASTSSSMNAEIHCPRLEEKTAAQDSPSNPSSTAPRGAGSRPGAENPRYLGYQNLKVFGLLYMRLEIALLSPVKSHAGICVCSAGRRGGILPF